jgi:hypothetical protein
VHGGDGLIGATMTDCQVPFVTVRAGCRRTTLRGMSARCVRPGAIGVGVGVGVGVGAMPP